MAFIELLEHQWPSTARLGTEFRRIQLAAGSLRMESFFEPKVAVDLSARPPRLILLDASVLGSWAAHISNSTRARMRAFEEGFLEQLVKGSILTSSAILRSHMEAAALAAYVNEAVVRSAERGNWEELKTILPKSLFGTSIKKRQRDVPELAAAMELEAQCTLEVKPTIEAMDRFAEETDQPVRHYFKAAYAILSEFTHANLGGTMGFMEVLEETADGWVIRYRNQETAEEAHIVGILDLAVSCMRVGYATAALLALRRFEDRPIGIRLAPIPSTEARRVWETFLVAR